MVSTVAIDTRDKRFSISSLLGLEIWPYPDGIIDAPDRLQWLGLYRLQISDLPSISIPVKTVVAVVPSIELVRVFDVRVAANRWVK